MSDSEKTVDEMNKPVVLDFSDVKPETYHEWEQRGSDLICTSCNYRHCAVDAVPQGKMLIKNEKGEFDIVDM